LLTFVWKSEREFVQDKTLHEKEQLAQLIEELGFNTEKTGTFLVMISGDMHSLAYDTGVFNYYGGFPIYQCSSIDSGPSCKWNGWSHPGIFMQRD